MVVVEDSSVDEIIIHTGDGHDLRCIQFADVTSELVTVASPVSDEEIERTTLDDDCALRTTVKVSVSPASVTVVDPSGSETVNPATSSSVVDTETVWSATASKSSSELASTMAISSLMKLFRQ